jgi:hypothetical protein
MLSGLLLGLPALLWVIVIVLTFMWIIAAGFRTSIGPKHGHESLIEKCGGFDGDKPLNRTVVQHIPECRNTWELMAEEYCPTVLECSFMVFRCVMGDCTSRGGQSLAVHFSTGYGLKFQVAYGLGMLIFIFGLFNVITAIFVEATMKGIAAENLGVKRVHTYKTRHVKRSLERLVARIMTISKDCKKSVSSSTSTRARPRQGFQKTLIGRASQSEEIDDTFTIADPAHLVLSEGAFSTILKDEAVQRLFEELDVNLGTDNASIFHSIRKDGKGQVRLPEMLDTLMRLRGDTSKADLVVPQVMMDSLADEIHRVQEILASHNIMNSKSGGCQSTLAADPNDITSSLPAASGDLRWANPRFTGVLIE